MFFIELPWEYKNVIVQKIYQLSGRQYYSVKNSYIALKVSHKLFCCLDARKKNMLLQINDTKHTFVFLMLQSFRISYTLPNPRPPKM